MKISILTPCFNSAGTIAHTIESVLSQDHPDIEHIILDGASRDATLEVVSRYQSDPRIRVYSKRDRGMYDALNSGLGLYEGEAFGVLNADDTFHDRSAVSRIAAALAAADIVHGDLDFVTDHASKTVVRRWRMAERAAGGFRSGWMPAHPTFYVRRSVAERVGPFDLGLKTASDYDYMLRAVELHGFTLTKAQGVLIDMMKGGASTSSLMAHVRHNLEALSARRRWLGGGPVDRALVAKPLRKVGQLFAKG
ncbi:glycosyltransferase family 2 protein [Acuticoccus yangtzensis]|uniref:glycosyltransferase family 2 protein n=1 Tax=Acuticoccus yangtzensis TaxID=1443441 RepID=UPI0009496911|nr:glycosyltransferase family 2 protein [Acuticoccus yangtzensis]ORE90773.1 family 2 glycosyl transferase [Stappia sp. 22II-S9-Z10]